MEHTKAQDVKGNLIDAVADNGNGSLPASRTDGHAAKADLSDILTGIAVTNTTYKAATIKYKYDFNSDKANFIAKEKQAVEYVSYCETAILKIKGSEERLQNLYKSDDLSLRSAKGDELDAVNRRIAKTLHLLETIDARVQKAVNKKRAAEVALESVYKEKAVYEAMPQEEFDKRAAMAAENQKRFETYQAKRIKAQA